MKKILILAIVLGASNAIASSDPLKGVNGKTGLSGGCTESAGSFGGTVDDYKKNIQKIKACIQGNKALADQNKAITDPNFLKKVYVSLNRILCHSSFKNKTDQNNLDGVLKAHKDEVETLHNVVVSMLKKEKDKNPKFCNSDDIKYMPICTGVKLEGNCPK